MSNKTKGSNAERELYHMFRQASYKGVRVAGSGMAEETACDLIVGKIGSNGKKGKKFCIEVKASKKPVKYITKEQIEEFIIFSTIFGLKPIIAVRFNREGWFFLNPKYLKNSGKNWRIDIRTVRKKGHRFSQMFS